MAAFMTEEVKTSVDGKAGVGGLVLYANHLEKGKQFFGRFEKNYVSNENVIASVQKKNPGTDELILNTSEGYIKREILEMIEAGNSVSLLGLGTLSIGASGSCNNDSAGEISELKLGIRFTPSSELKEAVSKVSIGKVVFSDSSPVINKITDKFTGLESVELTEGKSVLLEGKRLKLGDEQSAVYLAPVDEEGTVLADESLWTDCTGFVRVNQPKSVEFYLPSSVKAGGRYRIVIRSNHSSSSFRRKTYTTVYSDVVTIVAEKTES